MYTARVTRVPGSARRWPPAALAALLGCASDGKEQCPGWEPADVWGCMGGDEAMWSGATRTFVIDGSATVEEVTSTVLGGEHCWVWMGSYAAFQGTLVVLRRDNGGLVNLGFASTVDPIPLQVGDRVHVGAWANGGAYASDHSWIDVSRDGGAEVVLSVAGTIEGLHGPPGVTFAPGDERCDTRHPCGDYARYALDVTVDGQTTSVGYGDTADVSGWRVVHGESIARTEPEKSCLDYLPSSERVLMTRDGASPDTAAAR